MVMRMKLDCENWTYSIIQVMCYSIKNGDPSAHVLLMRLFSMSQSCSFPNCFYPEAIGKTKALAHTEYQKQLGKLRLWLILNNLMSLLPILVRFKMFYSPFESYSSETFVQLINVSLKYC